MEQWTINNGYKMNKRKINIKWILQEKRFGVKKPLSDVVGRALHPGHIRTYVIVE